jgi:hypothetical protein
MVPARLSVCGVLLWQAWDTYGRNKAPPEVRWLFGNETGGCVGGDGLFRLCECSIEQSPDRSKFFCGGSTFFWTQLILFWLKTSQSGDAVQKPEIINAHFKEFRFLYPVEICDFIQQIESEMITGDIC